MNNWALNVNFKPKVGTALACLLHARASKTCTFLPELFSIQFWRGEFKRETINQIAHTGICLGNDATLSGVDKIRKEFDSAAKNCKSLLQDQLENMVENPEGYIINNEDLALSCVMVISEANIDDELNGLSDEEETVLYSDDDRMPDKVTQLVLKALNLRIKRRKKTESEGEIEEEEEEENDGYKEENIGFVGDILAAAPPVSDEEESMEVVAEDNDSMLRDFHPVFTLCWNNVGKNVTIRHPSPTTINTYLNMALGYMAKNRVPATELVWNSSEKLVKATDIPVDSFIPDDKDLGMLRNRMEVIVGRILVRHSLFAGIM